MYDFSPRDIPLPAFLDPLLEYICSFLPPPFDSLLLKAIAYSLAVFSAFISIIMTLFTSHWDAQTILPPIITLVIAYLALMSFYRTTTWMIRTGFWFAKWGTMFGVLMAAAGYIMGNTNINGVADGSFLRRGIVASLGGFLLDMMNGKADNKASSRSKSTSRSRTKGSRTGAGSAGAPKAWESFQKLREWRNQEADGYDDNNDAQKVISEIVDSAQRIMKDSGWWETAKNVAESFAGGSDSSGSSGKGKSKGQTRKGGKARSR